MVGSDDKRCVVGIYRNSVLLVLYSADVELQYCKSAVRRLFKCNIVMLVLAHIHCDTAFTVAAKVYVDTKLHIKVTLTHCDKCR